MKRIRHTGPQEPLIRHTGPQEQQVMSKKPTPTEIKRGLDALRTLHALSPFEQFHTYLRGWRCGAGVKLVDDRFAKHEREEIRKLYNEGYEDGCKARVVAGKAAAKRYKYKPNILRTSGE